MRLKGRQGRFLGVAIGGWIAARTWMLWPAAPVAIGGAAVTAALLGGLTAPHFNAEPPFVAARAPHMAGPVASPRTGATPHAGELPPLPFAAHRARQDRTLLLALDGGFATTPHRLLREAVYADRAPPPPSPASPRLALPSAAAARAIEGQAYLFLRPGSGRAALAPRGSLGGSQAAVRVAVALNRSGPVRTAIAARLYVPLQTRGKEAAIGLDWHPLAGVPLRVSVERRIGLDDVGRDAWSAYAAGGFYAARLPLGLEADGYAQAGVVGLRARDLFADGAVRIGRRLAVGRVEAVAGAGLWGAAQPGARRLDAGPRLAVSLPADGHRLTLAVEGRLRVAGRAAPGSGAALTLAADF